MRRAVCPSVACFASTLKRPLDRTPRCPCAAGDATPDIFEAGPDPFALPVIITGTLTSKRILHPATNATEAAAEFVSTVFERLPGSAVRVRDAVATVLRSFRVYGRADAKQQATHSNNYGALHVVTREHGANSTESLFAALGTRLALPMPRCIPWTGNERSTLAGSPLEEPTTAR